MKKVSLFWCLGNLEAISFFSLFLTFAVQPPPVSRQRCHMNIRSGRCYLIKEGKTERETGCNQSAILQTQKEATELTADSAVRVTEAKWGGVKQFWSGQESEKKFCQNDKRVTTDARNNLIHFTTTHLHLLVLSSDLISTWAFHTTWEYLIWSDCGKKGEKND